MSAPYAFTSDATNLVAGDTNGSVDVFVKRLATGAIPRVSIDATGTGADYNLSDGVWSPATPISTRMRFRGGRGGTGLEGCSATAGTGFLRDRPVNSAMLADRVGSST